MVRRVIRFASMIAMVLSISYMGLQVYYEIDAMNTANELSMLYSDEYDEIQNDDTIVTTCETIVDTDETVIVETQTIIDEPDNTDCRDELIMQSSFDELYEINTDVAGWLTINNTKIDNVIVQCDNNEYYLDHNFYKEKSQPGTLFIDYRCNMNDYEDLQSDNVIVYGHKQRSGSMFGTLHNYHNDFEFYKQNPVFEFTGLYDTYTYKIVAMFACPTVATKEEPEIFDYHNYINFDEDGRYTFGQWMMNIKRRTEIHTCVDVNADDKFITLSTCSYEKPGYRFVVIARRLRAGETADVDIDSAIKSK